jgi:hypothetical protein
MERTVPSTASDEIDLYLRTMYSLLRSTNEVQLRTLEEVHAGMNSSLHPDARKSTPDTSAFIYSLLRLPDCMPDVGLVVLGQSTSVFNQHGYANVEKWEPVSARARRRRCFYDGHNILACYIASRSDIDDVIPVMTAYQIEWNKLHLLLQHAPADLLSPDLDSDFEMFTRLAKILEITPDDLERLRLIWGPSFLFNLKRISASKRSLRVHLLAGSLSEYWRATREWWDNIELSCPELLNRPIYFISSNTHSVANLLSGYALTEKNLILKFLEQPENASLLAEWKEIEARNLPSSQENFLYYALKKYQQTRLGASTIEQQRAHEEMHGIDRISSKVSFDLEAQVIDLRQLDPCTLDPRLFPEGCSPEGAAFLAQSDALILNIDYPLGLAAYHILSKVAEHASPVLGVYIMGKAASLNGVIGDIMIPGVIQDEHSQNTYLFQNVFTAAEVAPYLVYGTVLDNQKSVSVLGTFIQNARIMDVIYREGYTDIEMEAGPYLSAVYEMYRPKRHPVNEIVNLYGVPFDVGILHYVSDTPLSKGKNLGLSALSYFGMDSTYAATLAILRRIFKLEEARVTNHWYQREKVEGR